MHRETIIFDTQHRRISASGKSFYSDIFYIPTGQAALLSLFNMVIEYYLQRNEKGSQEIQNRSCVTVHKVSLFDGNDKTKIEFTGCGNEVVDFQKFIQQQIRQQTLRHEPVFQCGAAWQIDPCNNFALLPIHGFYMLELHDLNQADVALITYSLLDAASSSIIPDNFKLGSMK